MNEKINLMERMLDAKYENNHAVEYFKQLRDDDKLFLCVKTLWSAEKLYDELVFVIEGEYYGG